MRTLLIFTLFLISFNSCFRQTKEEDLDFTVTIPQKIGGFLSYDIQYSVDSANNSVFSAYIKYQNNEGIYRTIGSRIFSNEKWLKNEQLYKINNWGFLRITQTKNSEKVLIGDLNSTKTWNEFEFSPTWIERNPHWTIKTKPEKSKVLFDKVDSNGMIIMNYNYIKKNSILPFFTRKAKLFFMIDESGEPILIRVE